jgi:CheY-like chemotaxis protein
MLPDISGLELLGHVREKFPDTEVILFTGLGALDSAIQALRLGAYDYLVKSALRLPEFQSVVDRALERRRLALANRNLLKDLQQAQEELALTRARELTQIRRIGETLSRPLSTQELMSGLLELIWESLPLSLLAIRLQSLDTGGATSASRFTANLPPSAQSRFDRWLMGELHREISAVSGDHSADPPLSPPCPVVLQERLKARNTLGLVAAGRETPFTPEEAELFRIFALQGEAALRNVLLFEEVKSLAVRDGLTGLYMIPSCSLTTINNPIEACGGGDQFLSFSKATNASTRRSSTASRLLKTSLANHFSLISSQICSTGLSWGL